MKTEPKVDRKTAEEEIENWLDSKKISPSKRESKSASIESLVCAIMDGDLVLNAENKFEQTLKFPGDSPASVKVLEFKQRILINEVQHHLKNNKTSISDFDGRFVAYIQALTGQPNAVITKLESTDYDIAQSIAGFFM